MFNKVSRIWFVLSHTVTPNILNSADYHFLISKIKSHLPTEDFKRLFYINLDIMFSFT